jgi:hypothetical protein
LFVLINKINAFFYSLSSTQFIFEMLQFMFQDRLHWFGKHLTCSCYVAYVELSFPHWPSYIELVGVGAKKLSTMKML